jgi:hypothetical protein
VKSRWRREGLLEGEKDLSPSVLTTKEEVVLQGGAEREKRKKVLSNRMGWMTRVEWTEEEE